MPENEIPPAMRVDIYLGYPNQRFGNTLCTFHGKSTKTTAHSPTLKVGFAAEAICRV
jgi:hypothetical protein